jgi:4-carboxymuconolactone decarboxylase
MHGEIMHRQLKAAVLLPMALVSLWSAPNAASQEKRMQSERYERGAKALEQITGASGTTVVDSLKDIAPDLAKWIIEFSYGDVFSRPGLDLRSRELATVAALTAMGNAMPQLKVHIDGALHVGCEPVEIIEVILQMAVYAGFPASINGINAAREVFDRRGITLTHAKNP